ncbi:MAG TPA: amidohydrolase family protein [Gemmatimonadaceae bacterium]|nr:amidohydrolase family protein [Gemmatimonadaceae bacterium]
MRRMNIGLVVVSSCLIALVAKNAHAQSLIIRNATVIDGTGRAPQRGVDVCISSGRIARVARGCTVPRTAPVIDASGMYVTPGFVDMHVHLLEHGRDEKGEIPPRIDWDLVRRSLKLLLHHGVTTVRDPGSETEAAVTLRKMLERGDVVGPRLYTAGRIINSSSFNPEPFRPVRTADDIRREIHWQKSVGVDFIKVYSSMSPDLTKVAIDEAHAVGLPVIGHLQRTTWTEAARMGIDYIAHGAPWTPDLLPNDKRSGYEQNMFGRVYWLQTLDLRGSQVDSMLRELVSRRVVVDPTLIAYHTKFFGNSARWLNNADNTLLTPQLIAGWKAGHFTRDWTSDQYADAQRAWPKMLAFTKLLFDRGVKLTVGTDAPTAWVVPGASFHDELALLRDAGIPEIALIKMATLDGARALRRENEFGTVQTGRRADLVLLLADPLAKIENTKSIAAVIQAGQLACASATLRIRPAKSVRACKDMNGQR